MTETARPGSVPARPLDLAALTAVLCLLAVAVADLATDGALGAPGWTAIVLVPVAAVASWRLWRSATARLGVTRSHEQPTIAEWTGEGAWSFSTDADLTITFSSQHVTELLGYEADELVGRQLLDLVAQPDRDRIHAVGRHPAERSVATSDATITWMHRDGRGVITRTRLVTRRTARAKFVGHDGIARPAEPNDQDGAGAEPGAVVRRRIERVLHDPSALRMVFQPIVDVATNEVTGVEALSRFELEPQRPPNVWFAEAAHVGLSIELELLAIERALDDIDAEPGLGVSVNVSPETLVDERLFELMVAARRRDQRPLTVELTEHVTIDRYDDLRPAIEALREIDVKLAVDDAGAGYSSLQHILELRPDHIKLDRSIVQGVDNDPVRRALAAALMEFADDIGARVVAEGVERVQELHTLRSVGVSCVQGFLFGRPGPLPVPPLPSLPVSTGGRALVVDDDAVVRMLVARLIRKAGFEVVGHASNGREAVWHAGRLAPDLVLLDLAMPEVDGVRALPFLRRRLPDSKIVVLSASDTGHDEADLLALGADAFVLKDQAAWRLNEVLTELEAISAT